MAFVLCAGSTTSPLSAQPVPATKALILYDNQSSSGWMGDVYSLHLQNLLSHFGIPVKRKPLADYHPGDVENYDATFYVGAIYGSPLPAGFKEDLDTTTKTFVWIGLNLWQYAWDPSPAAFEAKYGFRCLGYYAVAPGNLLTSTYQHTKVSYKGQFLFKDPFDQGLTRVEVIDSAKATVYGTCSDVAGGEWPYIVRSGNFWFVPDMPMINTGFRSRSLVFADMLHDMLGIDEPDLHRAVLRIEDVSPNVPVETLRALRDALAELRIPFVISLIPEYRDWTGIYNGGIPKSLAMEPDTPFTNAIKELVAIGGQVIQHGSTHQIDGLINPYDGVSASDYEFFKMSLNPNGSLIYEGPLPGQDAKEVRRRVLSGHDRIKNAGLTPVGWLTPHYLGSDVAYEQFARIYPFALDRAIFVVTDADGQLRNLELNSPYIYRDTHGIKRIPETIGYIDPTGFAPAGVQLQAPSFPPTLIERARALKVVRNSWAGCYFHWYLNPAYLKELVRGVQGLGFEFVPVTGDLK